MPLTRYFLLIDTLARFSLKADARRYFLGYLWWILEPLLYVAVFYLVFYKLLGTRQADYLAFLVVGKFTFIWFSKSLNQTANSLIQAKGLIGQRNMPKAVFPLAVLHEGLYKQLPIFGLMLGFLVLSGFSPNQTWLWLVPIIVAQYLLTIAASMIAALLVCVQRDFVIFINMATMLLLFISGVFWDVNSIPNPARVEWLLILNPVAYLIDEYRSVLMLGVSPDVSHLAILAAFSLVLGLLMLIIYRYLNYWIARRVVTM